MKFTGRLNRIKKENCHDHWGAGAKNSEKNKQGKGIGLGRGVQKKPCHNTGCTGWVALRSVI